MKTATITYSDGSVITTSINGTNAEIEAYFRIGRKFDIHAVTRLEIHEEYILGERGGLLDEEITEAIIIGYNTNEGGTRRQGNLQRRTRRWGKHEEFKVIHAKKKGMK